MDKSASAADANSELTYKYVYVWDMDETLILLKSLLEGTYAVSFNGSKDIVQSVEIGKRWENIILQVCDQCFFYEAIENYNEPFLNTLVEYDDGKDLSNYDFRSDGFSVPYDAINKRKLAYRHRVIAERYKKGLNSMLDHGLIQQWNELYAETDSFADGWFSAAHRLLLEAAAAPSEKCRNVNALVSSGSLIPSLAKCLLYRLDDAIACENVYSSWEVGKLQCFNWIKQRFEGPDVRFCVIGDGIEECEAAQALEWPYIKVDFHFRSGSGSSSSRSHRLPGLTIPVIHSCINSVYGPPADETEE